MLRLSRTEEGLSHLRLHTRGTAMRYGPRRQILLVEFANRMGLWTPRVHPNFQGRVDQTASVLPHVTTPLETTPMFYSKSQRSLEEVIL